MSRGGLYSPPLDSVFGAGLYEKSVGLRTEIGEYTIWGRYFSPPVREQDGSFTYTLLAEGWEIARHPATGIPPAPVVPGKWYRLNTKNWYPVEIEVSLI